MIFAALGKELYDLLSKRDDVHARGEVVKRKILSGEFDKLRVWKGTY